LKYGQIRQKSNANFLNYPTQILKQAKRVWQTAFLKGDGKAWVYFIFAACQWLPTNYSLYRKVKSDRSRTSCLLCLSNSTETVDHLLICPALIPESTQLRRSVLRVLSECKFPFASLPSQSCKARIIDSWVIAGKNLPLAPGSEHKIERLAWDFLSANEHKQSDTSWIMHRAPWSKRKRRLSWKRIC